MRRVLRAARACRRGARGRATPCGERGAALAGAGGGNSARRVCQTAKMKVIPSGEALGASIEGLDFAKPLPAAQLEGVLKALGKHGVVRFPRQKLTGRELADFSR